jgi:hypothetical protein
MDTRERLTVLTASPERAASAAAATVAVGAVACGVCCVLPFALPAVVVASSGGVLAAVAQAFWGLLYLATVMDENTTVAVPGPGACGTRATLDVSGFERKRRK